MTSFRLGIVYAHALVYLVLDFTSGILRHDLYIDVRLGCEVQATGADRMYGRDGEIEVPEEFGVPKET
jgi:hypothetical protein